MDATPHPHLASVTRDLGSIENLFAAYSEGAAMTFAIAARVSGTVSRAAIGLAVARVQASHPMLSVRIVRGANGRRSFQPANIAIPVAISETGDWQTIAEQALSKPFDTAVDALCRVYVAKAETEFHLVVALHHAIADGMSGTYIVRDIVAALADLSLVHYDGLQSLDGWLGADLIEEGARQMANDDLPAVSGVNPWGSGVGSPVHMRALALDGDLTDKIAQLARQHSTTVHSVLSVALAKARQLQGDTASPRVLSPINMRRHFSGTQQCGMFISAGITTPADGTGAFWEQARAAEAMLRPSRSIDAARGFAMLCRAGLLDDDSYDRARRFMWWYCSYDTMLTNLGRLEIGERFGELTIEEIWGPILRCCVNGEDVIGAATLNGSLRLTHTSSRVPSDLLPAMRYLLQGLL